MEVETRGSTEAEIAGVGWAIKEEREGQQVVNIHTDSKTACQMIGGYSRRGLRKDIAQVRKMVYERELEGKEISIVWESRKSQGIREAHSIARRGTGDRIREGVWDQRGDKRTRKEERWKYTMKRWQEDWEQGEKGAKLRVWCREVGRVSLGLNFEATQLATNHGDMGEYLKRFNLKGGGMSV